MSQRCSKFRETISCPNQEPELPTEEEKTFSKHFTLSSLTKPKTFSLKIYSPTAKEKEKYKIRPDKDNSKPDMGAYEHSKAFNYTLTKGFS